ncbi:MAG: hypothetical protein M3Y09_18900 [Actinomycetota bacterium]|nr:hypothetical protein [Actinomycetota bacterium]
MAHWFDDLARTYSRRSALRGAGLTAAALLLPIRRLPTAEALESESCFLPCLTRAAAQAIQATNSCDTRYAVSSWAESVPSVGAVLKNMRNQNWTRCYATASLDYHEEHNRCTFQPDCGDPSTYHGTTPIQLPPQSPSVCPGPSIYVNCGDQPCCDLAYASCVGCNNGPVCCRNGGNCCGG